MAGFWKADALRHVVPSVMQEGAMRHEGLTVFLLFFGLALLDAVATGHWVRAIFWLGVGACFVLLDRWGQRRHVTSRRGDRPFWS